MSETASLALLSDPALEPRFALNDVKWGEPTFGSSGGQVTWSAASVNFQEQPFNFEGTISGEFLTATQQAFDAWEAIADIDFVQVEDGQDVDIRLGFDAIDGSGGTLAQAFFRFIESTLTSVSIRFDTGDSFVVGEGNVGGGNVNYKTVALHEIGHGIGLAHTTETPAIMQAFIDDDVNELQSDDIAAAQFVYGVSATTTTTETVAEGTDAADVISGSSSNDVIRGASGADLISGNGGDDLIYGNKETDTIFCNSGADTIFGGQNNGPETTNNGTSAQRTGADVLDGGDGADLIYGNHGGDSITGGDGDDSVFAGQDNDSLFGGFGNDLLQGNRNDDVISAGGGDDTLVGGPDNDTLFGSSGFDKFRFSSGSGDDVVIDEFVDLLFDRFEIETNINGTGVSTGADMLARISDNSAGQAVIDLGDGNTITYENVSANFFISSDFEFF